MVMRVADAREQRRDSIFFSTIIPTIGRPSLTRAVNSVLEQEFPLADFEIIVVNDSGRPLAAAEWQDSRRVRMIHTNRRTQSVARNVGAAVAGGRFLHFLDDDDWMLPGAFASLSATAGAAPTADWVYGGTQLFDRQGNYLLELHHGLYGSAFIQVLAGEWIPLTSSMLRSVAFFRVGGFNPLLPVSEDIDLCRRIALKGAFAGTEAAVGCHTMGKAGSSSPRSRDDEFSQWSREMVLDERGSFARMLGSANSGFWYGRICRAYFTSAVWNLQNRKSFVILSRIFFGCVGATLSARHFASREFWEALAKRYQSKAFEISMKDIGSG